MPKIFPIKISTPPYSKPQNPCSACPLYSKGQGFVFPSGSGTRGVLYVAEAPGGDEAFKGEPMVGAAGAQLDQLLRRARIERDGLRLDNVLHCRPPKNELVGTAYEGAAINTCAPFLDQTIEEMKPKVIVALGNTAMRRLTSHSGIRRYRGFVLDGPEGIPIVSTFHPSFLLPRKGEQSSAKWTGVVIWDLLKAERIAQEGWTRGRPDYLLDPSPAGAMQYVGDYLEQLHANPSLPLAWDIETPGKLLKKDEDEIEEIDLTIVRISFSFAPRTAMSIPWSPPYMEVIEALLNSPGPKVGWNSNLFDVPVVRANGVEINGELHDAMNAWHVLQPSLPKKLENVASFYADHLTPWKHLSQSDQPLYSAIDADATICNWMGIKKGLEGVQIPEAA